MKVSTNSLIAILRALTGEVARIEGLLANGEDDEEMSLYLNDLFAAIAEMSDIYQDRAMNDTSLTAIGALFEHFSRESK